jgi:hypothetical protein
LVRPEGVPPLIDNFYLRVDHLTITHEDAFPWPLLFSAMTASFDGI